MFVACLGQILLYLDVLENGSAAAHPCTANLISYILTHVLHITATYSGIEEQSEKGELKEERPFMLHGTFLDGLPSSIKTTYTTDEDQEDRYPL